MSREPIETSAIHHIYNRGVEKRVVFEDDDDYRYFVHLLYVLNDEHAANNTHRNLERYSNREDAPPVSPPNKKARTPLVRIHAFCLMPNHYHLLLEQVVDNGASRFMQKIGTGYTMYFNQKNERTGALFQGRYKNVRIKSDRQMLYIAHYIHMNPLDLMPMGRGSTSTHEQWLFLQAYRWSSLRDYTGGRAWPSITNRALITDLFGGPKRYEKDFRSLLKKPSLVREEVGDQLLLDIST